MPARYAVVLAILLSCSSPQGAAPPPTASASATPLASAPLAPGAVRFTVLPARSVATIRVREQIASVPAPGDAVLTTKAFTGTVVLLPDASFASGSVLAAHLDTLKSDSDLRDEWIKINTLQTRLYPRAEFTLLRARGVPAPLPATGEWDATIEGTMTIHGVERAIVWDLLVTRVPGEVRVRGTTSFRFGDYGMAVPANRLVLSVVDEVRLEIDLVVGDA